MCRPVSARWTAACGAGTPGVGAYGTGRVQIVVLPLANSQAAGRVVSDRTAVLSYEKRRKHRTAACICNVHHTTSTTPQELSGLSCSVLSLVSPPRGRARPVSPPSRLARPPGADREHGGRSRTRGSTPRAARRVAAQGTHVPRAWHLTS
eukprot:4895865-Prymnesium_polylepis.1